MPGGWRAAVDLFGKNQVSSFLIAGCGETKDEFLAMVEYVAGLGVFPYVLPLRPIPQTPLGDRTPPGPGIYGEVYAETARILTLWACLYNSKSRLRALRRLLLSAPV